MGGEGLKESEDGKKTGTGALVPGGTHLGSQRSGGASGPDIRGHTNLAASASASAPPFSPLPGVAFCDGTMCRTLPGSLSEGRREACPKGPLCAVSPRCPGLQTRPVCDPFRDIPKWWLAKWPALVCETRAARRKKRSRFGWQQFGWIRLVSKWGGEE